MLIKNCNSEMDWVESIHSWLCQTIEATHAKRIFIPAGDTPRPLYKYWEENHPKQFKNIQFVQVDEILTGHKANEFKKFFKETLPSYQNQIEYIQTAEQGADIAILGLGTNGHVAFHEPGIDNQFYSGCMNLNPETTERLQLEPQTRVVSFGLNAFMRCQAIGLIVRGSGKKNIYNKIMAPNATEPAAYLKQHANLSVFTNF